MNRRDGNFVKRTQLRALLFNIELLYEFLDFTLNIHHDVMSAVAPVRFTIWCDEELLEVPRYVVPAYGGPEDFTCIGHE